MWRIVHRFAILCCGMAAIKSAIWRMPPAGLSAILSQRSMRGRKIHKKGEKDGKNLQKGARYPLHLAGGDARRTACLCRWKHPGTRRVEPGQSADNAALRAQS